LRIYKGTAATQGISDQRKPRAVYSSFYCQKNNKKIKERNKKDCDAELETVIQFNCALCIAARAVAGIVFMHNR
jgi:hypothetical protein